MTASTMKQDPKIQTHKRLKRMLFLFGQNATTKLNICQNTLKNVCFVLINSILFNLLWVWILHSWSIQHCLRGLLGSVFDQ